MAFHVIRHLSGDRCPQLDVLGRTRVAILFVHLYVFPYQHYHKAYKFPPHWEQIYRLCVFCDSSVAGIFCSPSLSSICSAPSIFLPDQYSSLVLSVCLCGRAVPQKVSRIPAAKIVLFSVNAVLYSGH